MNYDVLIIGAGPGGIFSAYELTKLAPSLKVAIFEAGHPLNRRKCPIDGQKIKSCIECKTCSIMSGFGGAGAFSFSLNKVKLRRLLDITPLLNFSSLSAGGFFMLK